MSPDVYYKVPDMIFSHVEMDAYIHGLVITRNLLGQEKWDSLTFDDLFIQYPALQAIEQNINTPAVQQFKKQLYSRMNREHLLGANMLL